MCGCPRERSSSERLKMKPPRRAIYSYVCGGLHSLDHAALTSFEHERAHYGARLSPFVPHSERRQLDMTTTSAVLSAYPLWSRLSTSVLSASPHFGRGQVRGAPCTESISTLVAAESTGIGGVFDTRKGSVVSSVFLHLAVYSNLKILCGFLRICWVFGSGIPTASPTHGANPAAESRVHSLSTLLHFRVRNAQRDQQRFVAPQGWISLLEGRAELRVYNRW